MNAAIFDTCAAAKRLRDAGFDERQAEAAVSMVRDAAGADRGELATKAPSSIPPSSLEGKGAVEIVSIRDRYGNPLRTVLCTETGRGAYRLPPAARDTASLTEPRRSGGGSTPWRAALEAASRPVHEATGTAGLTRADVGDR